ncbi:MAG TPA: hypothetical protein VJ302_01485, partial [Blastocatellia bacterium]|nr:hypothetical protein [Blastocatellia bacterium]
SFSEELTGPEVLDSGKDYQGTHGYLPSRPEMRASLIIYGAGVNPGVSLPLARMVDIAPTAAALLNLKLAQTEGKAIQEWLKPAPVIQKTGDR